MASTTQATPDNEKTAMSDTQDQEVQRAATHGTFSQDEKEEDSSVQAGELTFEEDTSGGLGGISVSSLLLS